MSLSDTLLKLLDSLTPEQLNELRREIDQRVIAQLRPGTMDVDAILRAASEITQDMSDDQVRRMVAAMNEEYIEPVDMKQWQD
jgi:uncharacterized protein YeeX (DUF496 family)